MAAGLDRRRDDRDGGLDRRARTTAQPARTRQRPAASTASSGSRRSTSPAASTRPASTSAQAFGIYSNLLVRTLVGYNHVAGLAGNVARARPRDEPRHGLERRQDLHVPPQERHQVRPAAEPRDHVEGRRSTRSSASARKALGAQYGFYYDVIKGMTAFEAGKAKVDLGHQDARPEDDRLQPHGADGRLPLPPRRCRPPARCRRRSPGCFTQPDAVRPLPDLLGPVHDRRLGQARRRRAATTIKAVGRHLGLRRRARPRPRPQPRLRPDAPTARRRARTSPTSSRSPSTRTPTTSTPASRAATSRTRSRSEPPTVLRQYHGSPQLHTNAGDRTWYLTMNLTQPPFDDVHVRRAVNFVVDREALRKAWGGAVGRRGRDAHRARRHPRTTSSRATRPTARTAAATSPRPRPR